MSVHEDTLQGLHEALEHAKGKLDLKTTVIEVPDEEIKFTVSTVSCRKQIS